MSYASVVTKRGANDSGVNRANSSQAVRTRDGPHVTAPIPIRPARGSNPLFDGRAVVARLEPEKKRRKRKTAAKAGHGKTRAFHTPVNSGAQTPLTSGGFDSDASGLSTGVSTPGVSTPGLSTPGMSKMLLESPAVQLCVRRRSKEGLVCSRCSWMP